MEKTTEPTKTELEARIEELEQTVQSLLPNRRQVLKGLGVVGAGGVSLLSSGSASAATGDGTQIGTPTDRPTVYADDVDSNSISVDSIQSRVNNGSRVATDASDLQQTLDDARSAASGTKPQAVHLVPNRTYDITETVTVPEFVTLHSNAATVRVQEDVDAVEMYGGARQNGVLKISVGNAVDYTSDALKISAVDSPTAPIYQGESNVVMSGPVTVVGSETSGSGVVLEGGDNRGEYVTHCHLNVVTVQGFDTGFEARSGAEGRGFLNSNKIPECTFVRCGTAIRHTGDSEAKVLIGGHIQGSNVDVGLDSTDANVPVTGGSIRFDGHFEDIQHTSSPVQGEDMKITTRGGITNWNASDQDWSELGIGTTIDGFGYESAIAEQPTVRNWRPGDMVLFNDSGDHSGDGLYLRTAQWQMAKLSDAPPQSNNNTLFE